MDNQELLQDSNLLEAIIRAEEVIKEALKEDANIIKREVDGNKRKVDNF